MNFIVNIINKIIMLINRLLDKVDRKTAEKIKTSYYGIIFILVIIGIFIGYNKGKGSANKYGKPLTESTNDVFDVMLKKSRNKDRYKSMLETEFIEEKKEMQLRKVEFPANETIKPEIDGKVIETDTQRPKTSLTIDNEKVAEVNRTDEKKNKTDVRELKKEDKKIRYKSKPSKSSDPIDTGTKIIEK